MIGHSHERDELRRSQVDLNSTVYAFAASMWTSWYQSSSKASVLL